MRLGTAVLIGVAAILVGMVGLSLVLSRANGRNAVGSNRYDDYMHDDSDDMGMMGGGMGCPMCGGPWQNPRNWDGRIPGRLPQPKNREWEKRLQATLTLEKLSLAQYSADEGKFRVRMPYMMIIPQERNHIDWIGRLFSAYGVAPDGEVPPVEKSESVRGAYRIGRNLEADLIPRYTWLIQNAGDDTTKRVLDTILFQTRMHYMMFTHVLEMRDMGMPGMDGMYR